IKASVEEWRWIDQYNEVSSFGRVRSLIHFCPENPLGDKLFLTNEWKLLPICHTPKNSTVGLKTIEGGAKYHSVHLLVLALFRGTRVRGYEACHENDLSWDNRLHNLRWDKGVNNKKDSMRNRL